MKIALRVGVAALIALVVIWFINESEWVEVDRFDPPKGEAAHDPLYAARKLLANLGVKVESRTQLDAMPPRGARLLLTSNDWALFAGRPKQLEDWVRGGGHLVVPVQSVGRKGLEWIPVTLHEPEDKPAAGRRIVDDQGCFDASDAAQKLRVCGWPRWQKMSEREGTTASWRLQGPTGIESLRVPFGAGTVTVAGPQGAFDNQRLLKADNPLLFAAAMQADRGVLAWVVTEESRERLVPWAWREGWIAVLLVAAAIAAGVWRSAVRFGPIALPKRLERRSMAEQVAGTARFLRRHGAKALHAAQLRALQETATRFVAGYADASTRARVVKLAAATGIPEAQLTDAMFASADPRQCVAQIQVMEAARRRLDPAFSSSPRERRHANRD